MPTASLGHTVLSRAGLPVPPLRQEAFAGRFLGATLEQVKEGSKLAIDKSAVASKIADKLTNFEQT